MIREGALCVDCHRTLAGMAPGSGARDVRGFPDGHPQFRVTLVRDAATRSFERVDLGPGARPTDHPGLVFSHAAHLVPAGFPALGYKPLSCGDCHRPEPGGEGFFTITYKGQCQRCHALTFDAQLPWRTVPHGDDALVRTAVEGFYATIALTSGIPGGVPANRQRPEIERRVPATPAAPADAQTADPRRWVEQKTNAALEIIFDPKRGCFYCHLADPARGPFRTAPVLMRARFLLPARFNHAKHAAVGCAGCHDARQSASSGDVLIPGIQKCVACHGGENAAFRAQTTCVSCHVFHRRELGPMRQIPSGGEMTAASQARTRVSPVSGLSRRTVIAAPFAVPIAAAGGRTMAQTSAVASTALPRLSYAGTELAPVTVDPAHVDLRITVDLAGDHPMASYIAARPRGLPALQRTAAGVWVAWDQRGQSLIDNRFAASNGRLAFAVLAENFWARSFPVALEIAYRTPAGVKFGSPDRDLQAMNAMPRRALLAYSLCRLAMAVLIVLGAAAPSCGGGSSGTSDSGSASSSPPAPPPTTPTPPPAANLTESDVNTVMLQAVNEASARGEPATIAVVDRVGNVLSVTQMPGAPTDARP